MFHKIEALKSAAVYSRGLDNNLQDIYGYTHTSKEIKLIIVTNIWEENELKSKNIFFKVNRKAIPTYIKE